MSESVFRIIIAIILGIVAYWVIKGQITIIKALEMQPKSLGYPGAIDQSKENSSHGNPIGFNYQND